MENSLVVNHRDYGIEETKATELKTGLAVCIDERKLLIAEFDSIKTLELTEENAPKFKELRLKFVKNRTQGVGKWHRAKKDFFLTGGNFVDAIKRQEVQINESYETQLLESEKHFENLAIEAIKALQKERAEEIVKYLPQGTVTPDHLGEMDQELFEMYLAGAKAKQEEKAEAERLEEERLEALRLEHIAKEKAEKEEREAKEKEEKRLADEKKEEEDAKLALHNSRKDDLINFNLWNHLDKKHLDLDWSEVKEEEYIVIYDKAAADKKKAEEKIEFDRKEVTRLKLEAKEKEEADAKQKVLDDAKLEKEEKARKKAEKEKKEAEEALAAKEAAEKLAQEQADAEIEAGLNQNDKGKVTDLIADLEALKGKYSFKSVKNKQRAAGVDDLLDKIVVYINKK